MDKVYLVLWSGAYVEDGDGISSVHRTSEGAYAEAERLIAVEDADRKKRRRTYPSTYYEVVQLEVQP